MILRGDCLEQMKSLPDNSIDSIVSDPPYGLSFMGKKWDYSVPSVEIWREALRVLKPGGHLLAFGGTRTYHRLVVNIEDAGFEIRDQVMWIYGSGFPKSMDVSKQIDKQAGAKREVVGENPNHRLGQALGKNPGVAMLGQPHTGSGAITAPSTDLAKQWSGWGTALKPANEPICVARKPISEKTVAANVIKWGVGAINIDESRIEYTPEKDAKEGRSERKTTSKGFQSFTEGEHDALDRSDRSAITGRWPANVIFDEDAAKELDLQSGQLSQCGGPKKTTHSDGMFGIGTPGRIYKEESRGASRFFYVAKASKRERNAGLEGMPKIKCQSGMSGAMPTDDDGNDRDRFVTHQQNFHPTVKPIKLMEYLIKLVTPPMGTVLDPFAGSGSTGVAAKRLGFKFIGCELSLEYAEIAEKRIAHAEASA